MISRRGFLTGALAAVATVALPTPTLVRIINANPVVADQLLTWGMLDEALRDIFMPLISEQLFASSPILDALTQHTM